jgi:hypothetical protein
MEFTTKYINATTREYRNNNGGLMAVATNPTWRLDVDNHMDSQTRYYCLNGVFKPDHQTMVVSEVVLESMVIS